MKAAIIEYGGIKYLYREITSKKLRQTFGVTEEALSKVLLKADSSYVDADARYMDEKIGYYVPAEIIKQSNKKTFEYIKENIDSEI